MSKRSRRPALESLESRALLMGFSMNPYPDPHLFPPQSHSHPTTTTPPPTMTLALTGFALGTASVVVSGTAAVNTAGNIGTLGTTRITGTVRIVGAEEYASLTLSTSTASLTLSASGVVNGPLRYTTTQGTMNGVKVQASGHVTVGFASGPNGPLAGLVFSA